MLAEAEAQLRAVNDGMKIPVARIYRNHLMPLFVPTSFFELGNWPGPFTRLRTEDIGLTWTVLLPKQTMRYVDFEMQQQWEAEGIDWKGLALHNLSTRSQGQPGAYEMRRRNGDLYAMSFLFADGLGPSRLLFRGTLRQMFPEGYRVAIPERSCGFAYSVKLSEAERSKVDGAIADSYRKGHAPFVPGSYHPDELLPAE